MKFGLSFALVTGVHAGSVRYDAATHVAVGSSGCGKASPYAPGKTTSATASVSGVTWTYRVYVPSNYDKDTPAPLIFQHPGWGMTAKSEESGAGISDACENKGCISVTLQGAGDNSHRGGPWYSWNAVGTTLSPGPDGPTCTNAGSYASYCYNSCDCNKAPQPQCWWTTCEDTGPTASGTGSSPISGFSPSLYDTIESQLCIDTTREYGAGESNGGMMAYQLGVTLHARLAAIAPQFGSFQRGFAMAPASGVPVIDIHGTNDKTVPANTSLSSDGYYYTTTADIFSGWKKSNGCSGSPKHYPTPYDGQKNFYCVSEGNCPGGDVVRCSWTGGHNWLFNDAKSNGGMVTDFLLQWTKPSHIGMGATIGNQVPQGNIMQNITILSESQDYFWARANMARTLAGSIGLQLNATGETDEHGHRHYGNPKNGCRRDEDEIEAGNGRTVCAPKIKSSVKTCKTDADCSSDTYCMNDSTKSPPFKCHGEDMPVPSCKLGKINLKDNGCPTDASVYSSSKAWPVCLGKGLSAEPYEDGDFHCLLACPCFGANDCGAYSHSMCPKGATCQRGDLKLLTHGVCAY